VVGDYVNLSPGVILNGHVRVGAFARMDARATVFPTISVGEGARIGAGAIVKDDVPAGEFWSGIPARRMGRVRDG